MCIDDKHFTMKLKFNKNISELAIKKNQIRVDLIRVL